MNTAHKTFEVKDQPFKFLVAVIFDWYCTDDSVEVSIHENYLLFWMDGKMIEQSKWNPEYVEEVVRAEVRGYLMREEHLKFEALNLRIDKPVTLFV